FGLRFRNGFNGLAIATECAAGEKRILRGLDQADGNVVGSVTIFLDGDLRGFGGAGKQAGEVDVIAGNGFANFFVDAGSVLVMERFADALLFELVRKDAKEVEVSARA